MLKKINQARDLYITDDLDKMVQAQKVQLMLFQAQNRDNISQNNMLETAAVIKACNVNVHTNCNQVLKSPLDLPNLEIH